MFFYDNNQICVMAYSRCGHTSMYEHFKLEPYSLAYKNHNDFKNSTADVKVVVIRNPYDRLLSAVRVTDRVERNFKAEGKTINRAEWIHDHSNLELINLEKIEAVDYRIIDFYKLLEYIPVGGNTVPTYSVQPAGWEDWMAEHHSKEEMEGEYRAYEKIMQTRPHMNIREWHRLTEDPGPNIHTLPGIKRDLGNGKKGMPPEKAFEMMLEQAFSAINENTKLVNQSYRTIQVLQKRIETLESDLNQIKNS